MIQILELYSEIYFFQKRQKIIFLKYFKNQKL